MFVFDILRVLSELFIIGWFYAKVSPLEILLQSIKLKIFITCIQRSIRQIFPN